MTEETKLRLLATCTAAMAITLENENFCLRCRLKILSYLALLYNRIDAGEIPGSYAVMEAIAAHRCYRKETSCQ